jgi:CDP-6-deoxy-D-xylo-4-hexulose-3-dehydrase
MTEMKKIKLVEDTISKDDVQQLIAWLETNPILTKGYQTQEFEKEWSAFNGSKYSVFVNSGSSANLGIVSALIQSGRLKNNKVLVPAVSWSTTIAPVIQCGLEPILVDADKDNLGMCPIDLERKIKEHNPAACIIVHVLGFPCDMKPILQICEDSDCILIEDSCESVGSVYSGKKTGCFGLASSFSFYFGHHMSTIEGGMICTDDYDFYQLLKSIRSHGWDRDLDEGTKLELRETHKVEDFNALYTFYYDGFNLRSTDLQAFIGRNQLKNLPHTISKRKSNFDLYQNLMNIPWKPNPKGDIISNFAYPIITENKKQMVNVLQENNIECRPLICGSIGRQPFWVKRYGVHKMEVADRIHDCGLYVPNHQDMSNDDVYRVCEIVNRKLDN